MMKGVWITNKNFKNWSISIFSLLLISVIVFIQILNGFVSHAENTTDINLPKVQTSKSQTPKQKTTSVESNNKYDLIKIGETDPNQFTFDTFNDTNLTCNVVKYNGTDLEVVMPDTVTVNGKTYKITTAGSVFYQNATIKKITTGTNLVSLSTNFASGCPNLESISLNEGINSIGGSALQNNPKLVSCNLPSTLTTLGDWCFTNDTSLLSIALPSNLITMGVGVFQSCANLKTVTFGVNSKLTSIPNFTFAYCQSIQGTIEIPKNVTVIGETAFVSCFSQAPGQLIFETGSLLNTIGKQAFAYCGKLEGELNLPEGLVSLGVQSFLQTGFTSIKIPSTLVTIPEECFSYSKISKLTIPGTVRNIGEKSFYSNPISQLTFESGLQVIGPLAFGFIQAKEAIIPSSVQEIGYQAFWAGKLEKVVIPSHAKLGYQNFLYDAFSWNNIWDIEIDPVNGPIGIGNQTFNGQSIYKHLTYTTDIPIDDLFNVHVDGINQARQLRFSNLSNGVTYSNGVFHVPSNVSRFVFNFDGYITSSGQEDKAYNGIYTVDFGDSNIRVRDLIVVQGSSWDPSNNFVSAVDNSGNDVPFSMITVNPNTIDTNILGTYPVTYSYQSSSSIANVIVTKRTTPTSSVKVNYFIMNEDGSKTTTLVPGAPTTTNIEGFLGLNWSFEAVNQIGDYELVGSSDPDGHYTTGLNTQNGTFKEDTGNNPQINFYYSKKNALFFNSVPPDLNFGSMHYNGSTNPLVNSPAYLKFHVGSSSVNSQLIAQLGVFKPDGHGGPDVDGTIKIQTTNDMISKDGIFSTIAVPTFADAQFNLSSTDLSPTVLFNNLSASNRGNWMVSFKGDNTSLFIPRLGSAGKYKSKITWTIVSDYP